MPAFYFVLGIIPAKYRSRLNLINLVLLLLPLLDDIKILETSRLKIKFESQEHIFRGTVSMAVAENAAHASGGNFSTVDQFFRFCNCTKDKLMKRLTLLSLF